MKQAQEMSEVMAMVDAVERGVKLLWAAMLVFEEPVRFRRGDGTRPMARRLWHSLAP